MLKRSHSIFFTDYRCRTEQITHQSITKGCSWSNFNKSEETEERFNTEKQTKKEEQHLEDTRLLHLRVLHSHSLMCSKCSLYIFYNFFLCANLRQNLKDILFLQWHNNPCASSEGTIISVSAAKVFKTFYTAVAERKKHKVLQFKVTGSISVNKSKTLYEQRHRITKTGVIFHDNIQKGLI